MNNKFSYNLKKIRKDNNLSQEQLADELGVSRQAISKWESGAAYPEMDKIIAICDKFDLNIDDLLHRDIKEVKGEEQSKKNLNKYIDDTLKFITDTVNLFSNMNFKSKIKCLFEQGIIALFLICISLIIYFILGTLGSNLYGILPYKLYYFFEVIGETIVGAALIIASIIIFIHIFKMRYLDYYNEIKNDVKEETKEEVNEEKKNDNKEDNKICFRNNENKIIIRDPSHSEYRFVNGLARIIIGIFKFFALCLSAFVIMAIIFLFIAFVSSFLLYKTGAVFFGLLATTLSSAIIAIIILLILINFVFNRINDKKKMIWTFIISLVTFGIGCGLIFVGSLSFDVVTELENPVIVTKEYKNSNNILISPYYDIEYDVVDSDIITIDYAVPYGCTVEDAIESDETISPNLICDNPTSIIRDFIKNINDNKKIVISEKGINKITIHANKKNIKTIKENIKKLNNDEIW